MRAKFSALDQQTHGIRLRAIAKFNLDRFILPPSGGEKTHILAFFALRHFVVSPVGGSLTKLNTGAQLQTFPYPTVSNASMAKLCAQTLDIQKRDRQTDRQKTQHFWPPWWQVKSEPHQSWRGDRGPGAHSFTSKTFGGPKLVSPLGPGTGNFGCNRTSST